MKRLSSGTTEVAPSRIRSGEPQDHGNFVVKTDACGELETPSTLEACAPRDDLRALCGEVRSSGFSLLHAQDSLKAEIQTWHK